MDRTRIARPISGGSDAPVDELPFADAPPADAPPVVEPPAPTAEADAARLREENARLAGENRVLRETRRDPPPPATTPVAPVDPHAAEFAAIERAFAAGDISDAQRTMRLGALGAEATLAKHAAEALEAQVRTRDEQARARSSQTIAVYLQRRPGLSDPNGPEMQRVRPHLHAVAEEFGLDTEDPRAQVIALERTYGPLNRSPHVDPREFERRRHAGGGGGMFADEPAPLPTPKSQGERLWNNLLPEYQAFFVTTRGSKEAAIKTLEHADEHQMRKQGRFR